MNIRYIENKPLDMHTVSKLLEVSERANHWSNFGPLSTLLENTLAEQLKLPDQLRVVACANATIALHTLAAMHQTLADQPLRWASSAFGFYSSANGILHDAHIVDCNTNAMLDLDKLDPNRIDGLIVTNVFGQLANIDDYQHYAQKHNKLLLVDSAMAFHPGNHIANECISLHHTKPWGFGEGGCAIVHQDNEQLFRSLIAFGHSKPSDPINRLAVNGKISEIACAYILMRLQQMQDLKTEYHKQYQRIVAIAKRLDLTILANVQEHPGIPASVPLLLPKATALPNDCELPIRRYYYPLIATQQATAIYNRIVNMPCHSDIAACSDQNIENVLLELLQAQ